MLEKLFKSKTCAEILRILFDGQGKEYYLRALLKLTDCSLTALQKEIKSLVEMDLISARLDGNRIYYCANQRHPLFWDLKNIVEKTTGAIFLLQSKLKDERIEYAFIFGSIAKGEEKAESDIDLLIIGEISMREISKLLFGLQEKIGRDINPHIYKKSEFVSKMKKRDHFILNIMKSPKKGVIGNMNELEGLRE